MEDDQVFKTNLRIQAVDYSIRIHGGDSDPSTVISTADQIVKFFEEGELPGTLNEDTPG